MASPPSDCLSWRKQAPPRHRWCVRHRSAVWVARGTENARTVRGRLRALADEAILLRGGAGQRSAAKLLARDEALAVHIVLESGVRQTSLGETCSGLMRGYLSMKTAAEYRAMRKNASNGRTKRERTGALVLPAATACPARQTKQNQGRTRSACVRCV
jgi:hypothetical protein